MIVLRDKTFSMADRIIAKLEKERIEDFDVVSKAVKDSFCITADNLNDIRIYIPEEEEYSQYELDDYIRHTFPLTRTSTTLDRNIFIMKLSRPLTESQYLSLVKHIIEDYEYCSLIKRL